MENTMAIFTNQATLSYRNGAVSSNVVTGEIIEVLSVVKNAPVDVYSAGDTVTYVVSILNSGTTASTGVSVVDDLGAYQFGSGVLVPLTYIDGSVAYYSNGVLQPAPQVTSGPNLTISGITVPAGGSVILVYEARVNQYAPLNAGGEILNTATVIGNGVCEGLTAQETITVNSDPILGINKSMSPSTVAENGQLTYTFTVQNFGNAAAVATDNLTVTDTFAPILDPIVVTYNGVTWTAGVEYQYDSTTGSFATIPSNVTVPAATFIQDPETGEWNVIPGVSTITVTGTVRCDG